MPVPAAGLSDIGAGDAQPPMLGGSLQYPGQKLAVASLELFLLAQRGASVGNTVGERIANPLELPKPNETRSAGLRRNSSSDLRSRKGLGGQPSELMLQTADLAAQLGASESLVASSKLLSQQNAHRDQV